MHTDDTYNREDAINFEKAEHLNSQNMLNIK